jgi:hypothetical protein
MIVYTYSRSALIGSIGAIGIAVLWSLKPLYKRYKKQLVTMLIIGLALIGILGIKYADNAGAILGRAGSTK